MALEEKDKVMIHGYLEEEMKRVVEDIHDKLKPFLLMHKLEAHFVSSNDNEKIIKPPKKK